MKAAYFQIDEKAQSLTEIAVFGSILLLVLAYFISQGIRTTYQQDVQMRAFRMALSQAYNQISKPDAEATVVLVEDKRVPDPRDIAGKGEFVPVAGQGNIIWGNSMQSSIRSGMSEDLPRMNFKVNDFEESYLTATVRTISPSSWVDNPADPYCPDDPRCSQIPLDSLYVQLPGQENRTKISWSDLRTLKPTDDSPNQAHVLMPDEDEFETEVISEVATSEKGPMYRITQIPGDLKDGDPISAIEILLPEDGTINPNYLNLDYVKEQAIQKNMASGTENKLQGFLPMTKVDVQRKNSLKLEEVPGSEGYYKSTTEFDATGTTITHYIRLNPFGGPEENIETITYSPPENTNKGTWVWQTAK